MEAAVLRKPEAVAAKPCEPARQADLETQKPTAGLPLFLQAKLTVNPPGDPMEKEADRVALAATSHAHACTGCSREAPCPKCAGARDRVQAKPGTAGLPMFRRGPSAAVTAAIRRPDGGTPLPHNIRDRVEPLLGRELGGVRVHSDPKANTVARALGARAITHRNDIWLARGESPADLALMAHEATHVGQQAVDPDLDVQRDPDPTAPVGPIQLVGPAGGLFLPGDLSLGLTSATGGVKGPLPAGETRDIEGLRITQTDQHNAEIEFGASYVRIRSSAAQKYEYYVEPPKRIEGPSTAGGLMLVDLGEPKRQARVRVSATVGVSVDRLQDPSEDAPQLVVHERYMPADEINEALFPDIDVTWTGDSIVLALDKTAIKIEAPTDRRDLNPLNYPDARFAYWVDPLWSGPQFLEKKITVVGSPGVRVREGEPGSFNPSFSYGRRIVPQFIRVPHPALVPEQGEPIREADFVGYQRVSPGGTPLGKTTSDDMLVAASFSGVTIEHPDTGTKVSIRSVHPDIGAAYAYQVVPWEGNQTPEIRVVVGPGAFVEVGEPVPASWRKLRGEGTPGAPGKHPSWFGDQTGLEHGAGFAESSLTVSIVEASLADQVPVQGTPLNVNSLGTPRKADAHYWLDTSDLASTIGLAGMDLAIGIIPIVGDLIDISEFVWALATDHDRYGRPVTTGDKVLMGVGAVIGLIPVVGDIIGKGLRTGKSALRLADAARAYGKSQEELELIVWQVRGVVKGDDAEPVNRVISAMNRGEDIDVADLDQVNGILRRLGADQIGVPSRINLNLPEGAIINFPGMESLDMAANWRRGLNAETRAFLDTAPDVARAYENMDPAVRAVLTKCGSFCLPPTPPTKAQQDALRKFLTVANPTPDDSQLIRTFLHYAPDLDEAILKLADIASPTKLRRFLHTHVDMADAALLARQSWRADPAFELMRTQARTLVRRGMSVDQLSRVMGEAARAGHSGPEFLGQIHRLWHKQPRPSGTAELLEQLASGGASFRNAEWALRYLDRARDSAGRAIWGGLEAFEVSGGRLSARIKGESVQFSSWQRFDSEEFISQIVAGQAGGTGPRKWMFDPNSPLGTPEDIQAAASQALQDAFRRGDPRVTQEVFDTISPRLTMVIDAPSAHKFIRIDAQRARTALASLEGQYDILRQFPLDEHALQRVMIKGPDVNAMKGQLLEELMAVSVRKSLETKAGREALGVAGREGDLVFIEGHRLSDLKGGQLTDGIIAVRRGDKLEILTILEAKSGSRSSGGLARSVQTVAGMPRKDKLELFNFIRDQSPGALRDYLAKHHPDTLSAFRWVPGKKGAKGQLVVRGATGDERLAALAAIDDKILEEVGKADKFRRSAQGWIKTSEIGGQVRRDVERLAESLGTESTARRSRTILVDGAETEVIVSPGNVQFRGVVPQDVDTDFVEEVLRAPAVGAAGSSSKGLGYRFEAQSMGIDAKELVNLTNALNMQLRPRRP